MKIVLCAMVILASLIFFVIMGEAILEKDMYTAAYIFLMYIATVFPTAYAHYKWGDGEEE